MPRRVESMNGNGLPAGAGLSAWYGNFLKVNFPLLTVPFGKTISLPLNEANLMGVSLVCRPLVDLSLIHI